MIPAFVDDSAPPGEKDVWNMLAGGPSDWVAIHSLDLAPWRENRRTELDFVVMVPAMGILCVEVKSHADISFRDDRWYPSTITRSPFKQAQDAKHALRRRLVEIAPFVKQLPIVQLCIFPNARFQLGRSISVSSWELMDAQEFRGFRTAADFCASLVSRMMAAVSDEKIPPLAEPIAPARVDNMVDLCLPVRKRVPERREEILSHERALDESLREPQRMTIRLCEMNPRVVVTGGAGTGKTLIAMELARRLAARNERVALVCFNQLVGDWMKSNVAVQTAGPGLVVDRAVRLLAHLTGIAIPRDADDRFWGETLPDAVQERLTDPACSADATFDYLIVDEAQDVLAKPWLWQCLMSLVRGGVAGGRFALFGDVERQAIQSRETAQKAFDEMIASAQPTRWSLSENCRNYDVVGKAAVSLSGLASDTYSGFLRTGGSFQNVEYIPFEDEWRSSRAVAQERPAEKHESGCGLEISPLSFCSPGSAAPRNDCWPKAFDWYRRAEEGAVACIRLFMRTREWKTR